MAHPLNVRLRYNSETSAEPESSQLIILKEHAEQLQDIQKKFACAELELELYSHKRMSELYEHRRHVLKDIQQFWALALMSHPKLQRHIQHEEDQEAISYLEDIWVVRDPKEPRCFTVELWFKENPFFSNNVLKKEYRYAKGSAMESNQAGEDGITQAMLEFSWERDVVPQTQKIEWKDDSKNLTKLYPIVPDEDFGNAPSDFASFFNFFEADDDAFDIGLTIANDIFPDVIDYYLRRAAGVDMDIDEDDSVVESDYHKIPALESIE